ncbi:hypothetical protein BBJ28_00004352 [Nothophytophthora sp. Chile5]|nr:hypothetical protein BBJ28_00004352 [Nothophytophthora sp. Chile5]
MLASLSDILAWKPSVRADPFAMKKPRRAPTATSEQDAGESSDDVSETESAESSQSGNYLFRRQQSCPSTQQKPRLDTQPESESDAESKPALRSVYSFARAGLNSSKLFLVKPKHEAKVQQQPCIPASTRHQRKPHSRSVDELSESDFLPLTVGTLVSTTFGLGEIIEVRSGDGITVVQLHARSSPSPVTLYICAEADDDFHAVPALVGDLVQTPSGEGRVLRYDARSQLYTLRVRGGGGLGEYEVTMRQADVHRSVQNARVPSAPRRQRCHSVGSALPSELSNSNSSSGVTLPKGLATAMKSFVTTSAAASAATYSFVSNKYYHGQPVITKFGSGSIVALDPQQHRVQVQLVWGATAFLNTDMIEYYPKALAGMDVHTKFGPGVVVALRPEDAIYTVRLHAPQPTGKSDIVYVPESDVHRIRRLAVTAASMQKQMRGRLRALAQRRFAMGERIVVAHQHHEEEPSSAGI